MRILKAALLAAGLLAGNGCAGVALTTAAMTTGVGVDQMANGVAYKMFPVPIAKVRQAALKALDNMALEVTADGAERNGWRIKAYAQERTVNIELEPVTLDSTRMRVVAHKGSIFFKDSETGRMVIVNTTEALDRRAASVVESN